MAELKLIRIAFFLGNGVVFSILMVLNFVKIPNQDTAKITILKMIPCPREEFFSSPVFVLITKRNQTIYLIAVFFTQWFWAMFSMIFFISCITYHIYFATKTKTSAKTQSLQKKFFIGNIVQICIPSVFWAIPCILLVYCHMELYYNQALNKIGVCFVSLHGVASMLATLYIHAPYRHFVYALFHRVSPISSMQFEPSHNSDVINFYYTNYTNCPKDHSFLATWRFVLFFTHSVLIIQIPLIIFTGYCIIQKTPKAMGTLKWAMLNVHFWSSLMDIIICSLSTPYFFFPVLSGFSVGLLSYLNVPTSTQALIGFVSVGLMFNSIVALFENRSSSFEMNKFRLKGNISRILFFTSNGVLFAFFMTLNFVNIPNQDAAKLRLLTKIPCPTEEFFSFPVLILFSNKSESIYLITVFFTQWFWTMFSIIFFITCITYYIYFVTRHCTSLKTQRLQRMFFVGNLVQISIPSLFWAIPCTLLLVSYLNVYYNQAFNNLGVCFVSLHGVASMTATLLIHAPYRQFIYSFFGTVRVHSRLDSIVS